MSVIAWDGKIIAADKRSIGGGIKGITTKIVQVNDTEVIAGNGSLDQFAVLVSWYKSGADVNTWPKFQEDDDENWTQLILASKQGVKIYGRYPYPWAHEDKYQAFGAGRELALGAMYMGANAIEAVKVASVFESSCGCGCDAYEFTGDGIIHTTIIYPDI